MVSFICDLCQDTVKKPQIVKHRGRCRSNKFICIDCNKNFDTKSYSTHNSCISEAEKYQGALYKGKKHNDQQSLKNSNTSVENKISNENKDSKKRKARR